MILYQILKIIFILCLITLFLSFFGLPSLSRYLEKRYVFADDKVDFDLTKPPAVNVYHLPFNETSNGNEQIIEKCINKTGDDYQKSIICVNENLFDKSDIILQNQTKDTKGKILS